MCALTAVAISISAATPAAAQFLLPTRTDIPALVPPKPLTRADLPPAERGERAGTGFFVDDRGHILTARHVVQSCSRIVVHKEGRSMTAKLVAVSTPYDLALLHTPKTRGLAAVFPRNVTSAVNDMVFAADYTNLPTTVTRGGMLANASVGKTAGGDEAGHIAITSPVTYGASGAPVLDSRGLVEGVISRKTNVNRVLAVGAAGAKAFLASNNIRLQEDDRPQISGSASRAHRAASISAGIVCLN
ncbi:S1 family peptidase [Tardiphaga alba]|uniref:S1 family peptidase n=1 Tax=Tardiphaga alba TaxID=340268 RepID=UPI00201183A1|nr:serine protease [Tardiphaga alba]